MDFIITMWLTYVLGSYYITKFVLTDELEKDHSMIEKHCLKNVVIFIQTILSFEFNFSVSRKIRILLQFLVENITQLLLFFQ